MKAVKMSEQALDSVTSLEEEYPDINFSNSWALDLRLPVIDSYYPQRYYFVTLAWPRDDISNPVFNVTTPLDDEAVIVASYMEFLVDSCGYSDTIKDRMESEPFYHDNGRNTVSFVKRMNGTWGYSRMSWRVKNPLPAYNDPIQFESVLDLIDMLEEKTPHGDWESWKQFNIFS